MIRRIVIAALVFGATHVQSGESQFTGLAESLLAEFSRSTLVAVIPTYCDERITVLGGDDVIRQSTSPASEDVISAQTLALDIERCGFGSDGFLAHVETPAHDLPDAERVQIEYRSLLYRLDEAERRSLVASQSERQHLAAEIVEINAELDSLLSERTHIAASQQVTSTDY